MRSPGRGAPSSVLLCLRLVSGVFIWEVKVLQRTFAMSSAIVSALRLCCATADSQSVARQAMQDLGHDLDDLCSWNLPSARQQKAKGLTATVGGCICKGAAKGFCGGC